MRLTPHSRFASLIVLLSGSLFPMIAPAADCGDTQSYDNIADLPDPLVGTDSSFELSHGNTYPAVFLPFAMSNWTAETGDGGWPYQYSANSIRGFRSTHRPSAWMSDYGPFSLMPGTGQLNVLPQQRASRFRHEEEDARAWRYRVLLRDSQVCAEMAPTYHGGMLRFTFPRADHAWIVLDAASGGSSVQIHPETRTITGTNASAPKGTAEKFKLFFVAVFDKDFAASGTWDGSGARDTGKVRSGDHVGAWIGFSVENGEQVSVRVGTSLISLEQAERNLQTEIPIPDFPLIAAQARTAWERELKKVEVQGGTEDQRRTFYTAMYHTLQMPRLLSESDLDGSTIHYSPYDGKVHSGPMLADTGFWDTFRAEFPLLGLLQPRREAEIIRAMLNVYDESGWLPKWPNPAETNVMIGTHADSVIASAYSQGIRDFDVAKAYAAIRKDATQPGAGIYEARGGLKDYIGLGYVPADRGVPESLARTLEYAYDDACVASMGRALGREEDFHLFHRRSLNYRNVFDAQIGFMRGRNADGSWLTPFDPLAWGGVYTEGNAWQWLWSVQQDVHGLIELLGGKDAFARKLDSLFTMTSDYRVGGYRHVIHEMTESKLAGMGQYAHSNEPVHHVIYLYDYAGQPWKTQKLVHTVMESFYRPGPRGWLGDEDTGQMSAWFIFSAMGFYPVNPCQPIYALGSPMFDRVIIHLENGNTLVVEAGKEGPADIYVQSVTFNGEAIHNPWIAHQELLKGGVLRFQLGALPYKTWGTGGIPSP